MSSNGALNPLRGIARVETVVGSEWLGISSDGITATYTAEATEAADNAPTLAQPVAYPEKAQAFVPFSIEIGMDFASLQTELARLLSDAKDVLEATKLVTGAGHASSEPQGLLTGLTTTQRVQTNTVATYAVADPWALKAALPARFEPQATFVAAPAIWDTTYRFVGTNATEPVQFDNGRGGNFLGRPKVESSAFVATTTTGSKIMAFGDFSNFLILDRIGMSVELVPHLVGANHRPTGQRGLYAYWRNTSGVLVPNAFRYLECK
jgi:HK97 family phage major capsid protein